MLGNYFNNQQEHPGYQPIRVLRHNIEVSFINYNPAFITEYPYLAEKKYLHKNIEYAINESPIFYEENKSQTPYIQNGVIHLHEIYLMYLWSTCFAIHTPFYKTIHENANFEDDIILSNECKEQMKFAQSIKTQYQLLDKNNRLNPELFDDKYMHIIGINNAMYVNALNFILSHEFAHAKYRLFGDIKDEERADYEAVQFMKSGSKNDNDLGNKAIAGLLGLGADMLLKDHVYSSVHPNTDTRMLNYINNLGIYDEFNEIWALACFIYAHWDNEYKYNLDFLQNNLFLSYKQRFINLIYQ